MRLKLTFVYLSLILCCATLCTATTSVVGHITKLDTTTPGATAFVRFYLRGLRGNQPRITGTGAIAPQFSGSTFYVDLPADASGNISGTIYSTRDSAGTGAGDIEAGGSYTAVYYGMQIVNGGIPGPEIPVHARSGGTLDIANVSPISTLAVVTAPTGDTTYARLDGGNTPFSGTVSFASTINATHGGSVGGTFSGNATWGGVNLFTTQLNFTNAGIFTSSQINEYVQSIINGCSPLTEFQAYQAGAFATDALTGCLAAPVGASVEQSDAVAGYANNLSAHPVVAGYFQSRCLANSTKCWGVNGAALDATSLTTGLTLYGGEFDAVPMNATSAYSVIEGVASVLIPKNSGTFTGQAFDATVSNNLGGTGIWNIAFRSRDAAAATAFQVGALCASGTCASQPIVFASFNSSSLNSASINSDATGNIILAPIGTVKVNSSTVTLAIASGSATVDLASVASGACTADSADVTLTGASVGDPVRVTSAIALGAGTWLIGRVTATNTGRFQLCNLSGGAVDRASDTYTISVVK